MIKYSYKDKELKVPSGIGNNNNESFEEGYDFGYEEGYEVAYPSGYTDGFSDGHVSGITEQKAKLVSTAITENGTYSREDGFNEVEVNVQPPLETLSVSQSGEVTTYTPTEGYYGISNIEVNAEGYGAKRWQDGIDWEYNRISQSAITLSFSGNGEWHKDFFSEVFCNGVNVNIDFGLVRNIAIHIDGNNIVISEPIGELGIQGQGSYYLTTANHDYGVGTWEHYAILREGFQTSNLQVSNVNFKVKTSDFENWVNPSYVLLFNGHWNETSQAMYGGFRINIDRVSTSTDGDYTWIFLNIL